MSKKKTLDEFKKEFVSKYGNKYDLSNVSLYINAHTHIYPICNKKNKDGVVHGMFPITPNKLLQGRGCPKCKKELLSSLKRMTQEEFENKATEVHCTKYTKYGKYFGSKTPIRIFCPLHGWFEQIARNHLCGDGCPRCGKIMMIKKRVSTTEEFIKKSLNIFGDLYDYSNVNYVNSYTPIEIVCGKHGLFYKLPSKHLNGSGCPLCNQSRLELEIEQLLKINKITFKTQASKKDLPWLGLQSLDFYLPDYNVAIECQGEQHFKSVEHFGGKEAFNKNVNRDKLKLKKCQENDVKLLYYSNLGIDYPYHVFEDKNELIDTIMRGV